MKSERENKNTEKAVEFIPQSQFAKEYNSA